VDLREKGQKIKRGRVKGQKEKRGILVASPGRQRRRRGVTKKKKISRPSEKGKGG